MARALILPALPQQLAFFGVGLLELNAIGFGRFNHFDSGRLQQLAVGGVSHGFFLHCGVHVHSGQFFLGDQLLHALFAQGFTQAPQLCRLAQPLMLEILHHRFCTAEYNEP